VSASDESWFLINASPDVLTQIARSPALWPKGKRHSPIRGIVLTNGDLDHVLGLFQLREAQPLTVYATDRVREGLERNALLSTLHRFAGHLVWRRLVIGEAEELRDPAGEPCGIWVEPFAAPGKQPLHLMSAFAPADEDNVGLSILTKASGRLVYLSACAREGGWTHVVRGCDALLFDGTFWTDDELVRLHLSVARAADMAHLPISGATGSLRLVPRGTARRMIYTHVNNTNPILRRGSQERAAIEEAGWELARDGMELVV
jgi:pyrroloquinoline quinone biosynthesis protein B